MLPVEILLQIFRFARNHHDYKALSSCCLATKCFSKLCSPILMENPQFLSAVHLQQAMKSLSPASFAQIQRLQFLRCCPIPIACELLKRCKNLRELELIWYIEEHDIPVIIRVAPFLRQLQKLRFWRSYFMCDPISIIAAFYEHCPSLKTIDWQCSEVNFLHLASGTELPASDRCRRRPTIRYLRLSETTSITDSFLMNLCAKGQLNQLVRLDLSWCKSLTDWSLTHVLPHLHQLTHVDFSGVQLTDRGLIQLANNCSQLRSLVVGTEHCPYRHPEQGRESVHDESIIHLVKHCRLMERICLNGCVGVTDGGVFALMTQCPALRELDLSRLLITNDLFHCLLYQNVKNTTSNISMLILQHCHQLSLAMERGTHTVLGPVESWIAETPTLKMVDLSYSPNISRSFLYGFRASVSGRMGVPSHDQSRQDGNKEDPARIESVAFPSWDVCEDEKSELCVLMEEHLKRIQVYRKSI